MARSPEDIMDDEEGLITEDDAEVMAMRERVEEFALRSNRGPEFWHVYAVDPGKNGKKG